MFSTFASGDKAAQDAWQKCRDAFEDLCGAFGRQVSLSDLRIAVFQQAQAARVLSIGRLPADEDYPVDDEFGRCLAAFRHWREHWIKAGVSPVSIASYCENAATAIGA